MIDFLDKVHDHEPRQIESRIEPVTRQDNETSRVDDKKLRSEYIIVCRASRIGESESGSLCA